MDTTFEPSFPSLRNRITVIEAVELLVIGFLIWGLFAMMPSDTPESFFNLVIFLIFTEAAILGAWVLYNIYIRIARAGGRIVDIGLWVGMSLLTATSILWIWIALDVNRWILSKLFYRGEAPVEYALSWRSKLIRKQWEEARKTGSV